MPRRIPFVLLLLALLSGLTAPAQPINWDSVRADYITKYQPMQVPAWLFPIIFEEGGGQRDTIYLGYDSNAKLSFGGSDTVFGEYKVEIDTTRFNTHWETNVNNRVAKTFVTNNLVPLSISFYKGLLPLKMYWDREAFYSDSLPFPDKSPAPRAQGEFWYDLPMEPDGGNFMCNISVPVLLTDTVLYPWLCAYSDTVRFIHYLGHPNGFPSMTQLVIRPWSGNWVGIAERNNLGVEVYPNPVLSHLVIESQTAGTAQYVIADLYGREVVSGSIDSPLTTIDLSMLPPGAYVVRLMKGQHIAGTLIIKQ